MSLLERESHLASLREYASEARQGHGRLVLVAGEAGAGKSALVEQLEQDLPRTRWSWGACDGLSTPRPLGPLFDLAPQLGGELADLGRAGAVREDLFGALLRQVSAPQAALSVIVIEDVHWADEATIDLLRFLGRRLRDAPVLPRSCAPWASSAARTTPGWSSTPRRRATGRPSGGTRRAPPAGPLSSPRTARRPRSTSGPCGSPQRQPGRPSRPWRRRCTTSCPPSCR